MSAYTAIFGAVALGFVMAAPAAGAVTHPQFTPVSYSGHEGVVRAAKRIHLDRPVSSKGDGVKKCRLACGNRKQDAPRD
jgi:hypothetical protein